jgi:hypothetical protein
MEFNYNNLEIDDTTVHQSSYEPNSEEFFEEENFIESLAPEMFSDYEGDIFEALSFDASSHSIEWSGIKNIQSFKLKMYNNTAKPQIINKSNPSASISLRKDMSYYVNCGNGFQFLRKIGDEKLIFHEESFNIDKQHSYLIIKQFDRKDYDFEMKTYGILPSKTINYAKIEPCHASFSEFFSFIKSFYELCESAQCVKITGAELLFAHGMQKNNAAFKIVGVTSDQIKYYEFYEYGANWIMLSAFNWI